MGEYFLAVFSVRTSTLQYNAILQKNGIRSVIVETPKFASASCGISVRFPTIKFDIAKELLKKSGIKNFVAFYYVSTRFGKTMLTKIS